jgi:hypothetical protein
VQFFILFRLASALLVKRMSPYSYNQQCFAPIFEAKKLKKPVPEPISATVVSPFFYHFFECRMECVITNGIAEELAL